MEQPASTSRTDENQKASSSEADLAQAFKELSRGEQTAQALEVNLTSLEKKLDDLLASFEESERLRVEAAHDTLATSTAEPAKQGDESGTENKPSLVGKAGTGGKAGN